MGNVTLTSGSKVTLRDGSKITIKEDSRIGVTEVRRIDPLQIKAIQGIAPVATHIKEVNHIDPLTVESLFIDEIRHIDPIKVEKFNVTNLPTVNMSLRQMPPVDLNVRRLPPVSIGTHQDFHVPSNYTVRGRFLGIEFFRIHLDGHTALLPRERYRREQGRRHERSFPEVATAGNPAIPSIHRESGAHRKGGASTCLSGVSGYAAGGGAGRTTAHKAAGGSSYVGSVSVGEAPSAGHGGWNGAVSRTGTTAYRKGGTLAVGMPDASFSIPDTDAASKQGPDAGDGVIAGRIER